jgi:hypothetical protein
MVLDFDDSLNRTARDSFNQTNNTTNTANLAVDLDNVGNSHSDNTSATGVGSFNTDDSTDNSVNHSYDSSMTDLNYDSNNMATFNSTDDHSVNIGNRSYDLGGGAGAGGAGGSATVVDQSLNANVHAWGGSLIGSDASAVVASGDGSMAAGGDIDIDEHLDGSTNISALGGDVNIDNTTTDTSTWFSGNSYTDNSQYTDDSTHVGIDGSFNSADFSATADDSFDSEVNNVDTQHWDVDANVIWGGAGDGIIDAGS